jgi:serine/threonine protein kinase
VSHYDIKCDNILIDFKADDHVKGRNSDSSDRSRENNDRQEGNDGDENNDFRITVGDFGECWMYSGKHDEFCTKDRGTEFIKAPEMLLLARDTRKDD